ncbi:hypothetical protein ACFO9Q_12090 [Paenibacillus sp. GCM10023252]|uniref:hypothetical protein n=1 Tax=Paenibacillus sp. GCM10023252 TaxID=3252649 RepID=UPI003617F522
MEKRISRSELLFSLGFLFMLVCAVGAFFYGVKIGSDKTETKYLEMKELKASTGKSETYQQQDLVSFYHTVFLPYREFQNEWFSAARKMEQGESADSESILKQLASLAAKQYKEAAAHNQQAPLLGQSQVDYLQSLKLFKKELNALADTSSNLDSAEMMKRLKTSPSIQNAVQKSLAAQQAYYSAMLKWSSAVDQNIPSAYKSTSVIEVSKWKSLPLVVKNKLMADQLLSRKKLTSYYPHDLTSRIDLFIASGHASQMKLKTIQAIIDLLISTEAIRSGDFTSSKGALYSKDLLPQLPFFFSEKS